MRIIDKYFNAVCIVEPVIHQDNRGNFIHYSAPKEIFSEESLKLHKEICESQQKIFKAEK